MVWLAKNTLILHEKVQELCFSRAAAGGQDWTTALGYFFAKGTGAMVDRHPIGPTRPL